MELSWVIAVLLAAMASFISNLGVTLQKLHHIRTAASDAVTSKGGVAEDYSKGWMWRVGLGLVFFGSLADFAALSFGPQSLVAPLGSLTLVSNVIFAPLLLKETIGHWDVLATVLIVLGSSIAVIFGSHEAVTFSVFQLFGFFTRWDFILYAFVISVYGIALYMAIQKIEKIEKEEGVHSAHYLQFRALHRFAYPSLSGTVGAQSVLFAKCFVELLGNTVRHWGGSGFIDEEVPLSMVPTANSAGANLTEALPSSIDPPAPVHYTTVTQNMFLYWQTYFVFFSMLGAIFAQIKYLNDGLRRFDASYSVPVFTSFWIILSVVSGMIFYREYQGMDTMQCLLFGLGVLITVTGVITLGGREQSHFQHQQLSTDDDEEQCGGSGVDGEVVHHEGSINAAHAGAFKDEKHSYGRSTHDEVHHSHQHHKHGGHAHAHPHGHDDTLELHLDDADLDDVAISHAAGAHASGSINHGGSHTHAHTHHVYVSPHANETEGTVADGAKTVVLEASQRIHQAFNKLRGKGADEHLYAGGLHVPSSSSSVNRLRSDSLNAHDESTDHSAAEDESADPLILKNAGRGSMARKSNSHSNGTTRTHVASRFLPVASPRSVPLPLSPPSSQCDSAAIQVDSRLLEHTRKESLTPTSSALYDPSPPAPSYTLPSPSSAPYSAISPSAASASPTASSSASASASPSARASDNMSDTSHG